MINVHKRLLFLSRVYVILSF